MFPSPTKILIVLAVIVLIFSYKKLPEIGKGLGAGIRNFRKGIAGSDKTDISSKSNAGSAKNKNSTKV